MKNKSMLYKAAGLAMICALFLVSCAKESTLAGATQTVDAYYAAIKDRDFDKASQFFIDSASQPRQLWVDQLRDYHDKLGDLQSYQLVNKIVNTVFSGARYTLKYKVKYSKHEAYETLILFGNVSGDPVRIETMHVQSQGL